MDELFICGQGVAQNLYIMRGIPGCGKSFRANKLKAFLDTTRLPAEIFSADYFYGEGEEYKKNWSIQRAHLGHRDCEAKTLAAMKRGVKSIIVDNTNINLRAFRIYVDYAVDHKYVVHFVYPESSWWVDVVEPYLRKPNDAAKAVEIAKMLASKTVHGVPEDHLLNMMKSWQWVKTDDYAHACQDSIQAKEREVQDLYLRLGKLSKMGWYEKEPQ